MSRIIAHSNGRGYYFDMFDEWLSGETPSFMPELKLCSGASVLTPEEARRRAWEDEAQKSFNYNGEG